ncbi:SLBB domain-containing protein [Phormidesmis sp. 146-33]
MRVSVIALGAITALFAHELIGNDAVTPSATSSTAKPGNKDAAKPTAPPQLPQAIAQPETLPSQTSARSAGDKTLDLLPADLALSDSANLGNAIDLPPPLKISAMPSVDRSISVDQLPLDAIVSASVQSDSKPAPAKPPTPAKQPVATKQPVAAKSQAGLTDIQNHPARSAILSLVKQGVVKGFPDGTFRPDRQVTDGEFKGMMQKGLQKSRESVEALDTPSNVVSRADAAQFVYQKIIARSSAAASNAMPPAPTLVASSSAAQAVQSRPPQTSPQMSTVSIASSSVAQAAQPKLPQLSPGIDPNQPSNMTSPPSLMAAASSDESYTLGAGDKIKVDVFNVPEYSKDYQVLVNGTLNLFRIGSVSVEGMTLKQAEAAIAARYSKLVRKALIDVTLSAPRPLNIAVAGEIGRPGSYTMPSDNGKFPTITRLIQQAGGMTQAANPRRVVVTRPQRSGSNQTFDVNLWELFQTGNLSQDVTLRDGDTVFIPAATAINLAESSQLAAANFATDKTQPLNIAVVGEVARPGPYVLTKTGGMPTITQAVQQAGGITQMSNIRQVEVRRATRSGNPQVIKIDLWQLLRSGDLSQDLILQQGDTISIPTATAFNPADAALLGSPSFAPVSIKVNVVGEVVRPGAVDVPPNTPLNQALLAAGGFNRDARKATVELIRLNPDGTVSRQAVPINLAQGIDAKGNPILRNNDIIVVDRSGRAKVTDTLDSVLGIVQRILPFGGLLRF